MKCVTLLFLSCCSLTLTSSFKDDGHSCVSAYWKSISCVVNIMNVPVGWPNITYRLEFAESLSLGERSSCPLVLIDGSYRCVCNVMSDPFQFGSEDEYEIKLCNDSSCILLEESFIPSQNIQLTPPYDVEVKESPETFNITWKSGYEDHRYIKQNLEYKLAYQTSQSSDNKTLYINLQRSASVQRSLLRPGATYCFRVSSKPSDSDYASTWSQWSPAVCLKNDASHEQDNILVILMKSLGPVCVVFAVLLFVVNSPAARMKIKTLSHTPSPATFFEPLYKDHDGNLQDWLSPKGKLLLTYPPDEILTADAVMVLPKPAVKDPEENQELLNPPLTELLLTQSPASYVGIPGVHEPPAAVPIACPRVMPYTRLPCTVWGVSVGEVEVVSFPVKEVLNISCADSGCSSEEVTDSPDCSEPNSPVSDVGPPLCLCTGYCILNKTADGFAPVLISKESSPPAPSDSQQEVES